MNKTSRPTDKATQDNHQHDDWLNSLLDGRAELVFSLMYGAALLAGWLGPKISAMPDGVAFGLLLAAYFFGGYFTLKEAIGKVSHGKFEIDFLMLVAAGGAAVLGEWAEGALLLFLFSFGHALERYAMGRAKRAIEALAELAPETARVKRGEAVEEIRVEELVVGDVVVVRPNERLPADGFVSEGASAINQAPVTGESVPVDKSAVSDIASARTAPDRLADTHRVFAGTINGSGALEVVVTRRSSETTLSKVVQMVSAAEAQQSPTQRFTQRFERVFVPAVLALAGLLRYNCFGLRILNSAN